MADQPFTHTDPMGVHIFVAARQINLTRKGPKGPKGDMVASAQIPQGLAGADMARAILAGAGDAGHRVVSQEELQGFVIHRAEGKGARSMRERAAQVAYMHKEPGMGGPVMDAILALPLLPGEDTRGADDVHVATPEGITPCGQGTRDVTVAALISEVSCVECLCAIAVERGEQVTELRRELDAESARVSAARDERDQALRSARELPARTTQLERDMASAEQRLAALEIAQREATQSGGAEHAQVTGGGSPDPQLCPQCGPHTAHQAHPIDQPHDTE